MNVKTALIQLIILSNLWLIVTNLFADEVCSFSLKSCPENFNGKVITVPRKVTSFSSYIDVCPFFKSIEKTGHHDSSLSIIFVIDHSNSMLGEDIDIPRDKDGTRFLVTRALVDTLQKRYPEADVGLILFREILFLDTRDNPVFVPLPEGYPYPGGEKTQGYIPLIRLDSTLANGMSGAEFIRSILETESVEVKDRDGGTLMSTDLVYNPDFDRNGGTNINVAFDAARDAFSKTDIAKKNQYIIFLSDGEANAKSGSMTVDDYVKGKDLPATFTIFFTPGEKEDAPVNIVKMTENIKTNNYSESNSKSNLWTIKTSFDTLLSIMLNNIMTSITPEIIQIQQKPVSVLVNNRRYQPLSNADNTFFLSDNLSLNDSLTHFELTVDYRINPDSLSAADTSVKITFDVIRTDEAPGSESIELECKDTLLYEVSVISVDPEASENENNEGKFEFKRDNVDDLLTVYYSVSGTAFNGIDFRTIADSAIFEKGMKTVTVIINPFADTLLEGDETVVVTIAQNAENKNIRYHTGALSKDSIKIMDNFIVPPDTVKLAVLHNPLQVAKPLQIPQSTFSLYRNVVENQTNGTIISVYSIRKLVPLTNTQVYGYGYIHDATGNMIKKLELKKANPTDTLYYGMFWNGTNKHNRIIGTGNYLLTLKIKNSAGVERVLREKVGVRR